MATTIGAGARGKGAAGEREVKLILRSILAPVYLHHKKELPDIERNLEQSRGGGYDLKGLEWLAIEVKRQERSNLKAWWKQTLEQTKEGQIPLLLHRANNQKWRARLVAPVVIAGTQTSLDLVMDLDRAQFEAWLAWEAHCRLVAELKEHERSSKEI